MSSTGVKLGPRTSVPDYFPKDKKETDKGDRVEDQERNTGVEVPSPFSGDSQLPRLQGVDIWGYIK